MAAAAFACPQAGGARVFRAEVQAHGDSVPAGWTSAGGDAAGCAFIAGVQPRTQAIDGI